MRIFIGESDKNAGMPLYKWIVRKAKEQGLAGCTVIRGIEGFGAASTIHAANFLELSTDLPIIIEIVDTLEKIEAFVPIVDQVVVDGLVTLEKANIKFYRTKTRDS